MGSDPADLLPVLRALRRYTHAALGSRVLADRVVEVALNDLLTDESRRPSKRSPGRLRLYRAVQDRLSSLLDCPPPHPGRLVEALPEEAESQAHALVRLWLRRRLRRLTAPQRHALLLCHLEGFTPLQIARILRVDPGAARTLLAQAWAITVPPCPAEILIIEDEMLTALDMSMTMRDLGHTVLGIASSAREAEMLLKDGRPDLILSELRLATGAGQAMLRQLGAADAAPIVFVTASEEPIPLPGQRAPAFVVRKPFCARHLAMAVCDALAAGRERRLTLSA
ncbi:sigma factor-like helix-turn-helix DNA-binding protein [Teichococcus aestuarii]|uniref:Response regulatory domain-containing protein n=1 Tax=Teichococcus aestuarii TaxID=568898 RepID=A0A2U1V2L0_9PROT|nr:sigma factor-like helix-turn-helix DNA-binding protein [Pseudoroseomonas aestuarii]PWC28159.1 hypothetical protein CR165_14615 [Pseudoroseomonas aestuarii]